MKIFFITIFLLFVLCSGLLSFRTTPLIIDHNCVELGLIPMNWIDTIQARCKFHYAHTSHGNQLLSGLEWIMDHNSLYAFDAGWCELPSTSDAFCIFNGQSSSVGDYITPDLYWATHEGMNYTREVLNDNPSIRYSMWAWCTQLEYYTISDVQEYLDSISSLEVEFPSVTFIYMTGNAQDEWDGGWNRHQRNEQIRNFCQSHNKVLYDFGDLDSWFEGVQATVVYDGHTFPVEHPHYHGDEVDHTTWESCANKGRAFWWMMARLIGWLGPTELPDEYPTPEAYDLEIFPNPFNSVVRINFRGAGAFSSLSGSETPAQLALEIFSSDGRLIYSELRQQSCGLAQDCPAPLYWCPEKYIPTGIYLVSVSIGGVRYSRNALYIK